MGEMVTVFIEMISCVNGGEKDGQWGLQIVLILYGVTEARSRQKISRGSEEVMLDNGVLDAHSIGSEEGALGPVMGAFMTTLVGRQVPNHEMIGALGAGKN